MAASASIAVLRGDSLGRREHQHGRSRLPPANTL